MEERELQVQAKSLYEEAKGVVVNGIGSMEIAGIMVKSIDDLLKEIAGTFDPIIEKAKDAKRAAEQARKEAESKKEEYSRVPQQAKSHLLRLIGDFRRAEAERKEAEARAEQERVRKEAEEKALAEAERLAAEGRKEEADRVIAEPVVVPTVKIDEAPKVAGIASRDVWKFEVTDFAALPDEYKKADDVKIGAIVRSQKEKAAIPGVRIYVERTDYTRS